nr:hypothetical protein CFP56_04559 [Quercus suber]
MPLTWEFSGQRAQVAISGIALKIDRSIIEEVRSFLAVCGSADNRRETGTLGGEVRSVRGQGDLTGKSGAIEEEWRASSKESSAVGDPWSNLVMIDQGMRAVKSTRN